MSKINKKRQRRKRALWNEAKHEELTGVRVRIGLSSDEIIPDAVLLAEVDHYLPLYSFNGVPDRSLERRRQWFGFRLIGMADTEVERITLARRLKNIPPGRVPWGLGGGGPSRRSPAAARRRNLQGRAT